MDGLAEYTCVLCARRRLSAAEVQRPVSYGPSVDKELRASRGSSLYPQPSGWPLRDVPGLWPVTEIRIWWEVKRNLVWDPG